MRTMILTTLLIASLLAFAPTAEAKEEKHCYGGFQDCDWLENTIEDLVGRPIGKPAGPASTCDGWPTLVGKVLDECPHGPTL